MLDRLHKGGVTHVDAFIDDDDEHVITDSDDDDAFINDDDEHVITDSDYQVFKFLCCTLYDLYSWYV